MSVTAPPRPPRPSDPIDREELEAFVEALIEEARQRQRRRRRIYMAAAGVVALVSVVVLTIFERTAQAQTASPASAAPSSPAAVVAPSRIALMADLFYDSGKPKPGATLYVVNADGSGKRILTRTASSFEAPAWSPDGRKLAFERRVGPATEQCVAPCDIDLFVMNADGSGQRNLTRNPVYDYRPVWSPDGQKLAFGRYRDVWVMNADDGSDQRRLTPNQQGDDKPVWSPDGQQIAFGSFRAFNWDVWVMNADGSGHRNLTRNRETQAFGLAVPSGIVTHTGVAGLTLGGGIGWIMRKHGLSVDQLVSVDLVTADGEFAKASADENADLFWGVRGGGGNFGIVTEFEFRCVPLGTQVLAGPVFWPMQQSGEVLRFYRDWVAEAPDELMTIVVHRKAPPLPFVPEELHGKPVVMVVCCWAGDVEEGEKFIRPLREFGSPVADVCVPKPYLAHQAMLDPSFVPGRWYYFKSCDVAELSDEIIDITVERSLQIDSPLTSFPIWQMGGAVARVGDEGTAFNGRSAGFTYNVGACTETKEGFEEEREWVRNFWSALEPWHEGVYVNFLGDEGVERVRQSYGPEKYDRLRALKQRYDPDNFFRINQNISPS